MDEELQRQVYAVQPGDTWDWWWWDLESGNPIAVYGVTFLGGDQYCWSDGFCGTATEWWVALPLRCMPEHGRVRVDTFHNNVPLGGGSFQPTPFVPEIEYFEMASALSPRRTRAGEGEATDVDLRVVDDLGCGQAIPGVRVEIESVVGADTNAQPYFTPGDPGTGRFLGLGFEAEVNTDDEGVGGTRISGRTDDRGLFRARYRAQAHGVEEVIRSRVSRASGDGQPTIFGSPLSRALRITVPGLVRITEELGPVGFVDGGTCPHDPLPHWLAPDTLEKVLALAETYFVVTGRKLSINDASLPMGGVIARGRINVERENAGDGMPRCHGSHRHGIDIDINRVDIGGKDMTVETVLLNDLEDTLLEFMDKLVMGEFGGRPYHSYSRDGQLTSIHWRLP